MASSTGSDIKKILAARNTKVQIDALKFEIKKRDMKIDKLKLENNNLKIENDKLKAEIKNVT